MTIQGPRLTDSHVAQEFLRDLLARPEHVRQGIDNAMDRLAELPTGDWQPQCDDYDDQVAQDKALAEVYVRGVLACGLVLGQVTGHQIFYTPPEPMATYGEVGVGALLRANNTMVAAQVVFPYLDDDPYFEGFHDGHAEVLVHLAQMVKKYAGERLKTEGAK